MPFKRLSQHAAVARHRAAEASSTRVFSLSANGTLLFMAWVLFSLALVFFLVALPPSMTRIETGMRLGHDWPIQVLQDVHGALTPDAVAALPDSAFTLQHSALNHGYTRDVYWLRVAPPPLPAHSAFAAEDPLWLEILPPYLDHVTLYQRSAHGWQRAHSGDTVPMSQRLAMRQLAFALQPGQPFLLRVQTTSPMQLDGRIWRSSDWLEHLGATELSSGLHHGVGFSLVMLLIGAAVLLRLRSLAAAATAAGVSFLHGAADRGYLQIWLPASLGPWADVAVSIGTLVLPAALVWPVRELLTRGTTWRRMDRAFMAIGLVPLLCLPSIPLGRYSDWAWLGIIASWLISGLWAAIAWSNLWRQGATLVNTLMVLPSSLLSALGVYVIASYLGWVRPPAIEASLLWQLAIMGVTILLTLAIGAGLVQKFIASMAHQEDLAMQLRQSEAVLEQRVHDRSEQLLKAQNRVQLALHRETQLRQQQRQFFDAANHALRTPLTVIDSAATEQIAFPSADLQPQIERAAQIRQACQRLAILVDNCLVSDRLDADGFQLHWTTIEVEDLIAPAVRQPRWSSRHELQVDVTQAPQQWTCDAMLVRTAIANLVDIALRHTSGGVLTLQVTAIAPTTLVLHVCMPGTLPPDIARHLQAQTLEAALPMEMGLPIAQRVARLHGGDLCYTVHADATCLRMTLRSPA